MGVFTGKGRHCLHEYQPKVAIPFRVGWGFSRNDCERLLRVTKNRRNPFQGGMGFFTFPWSPFSGGVLGRNPFQGGMGFFTYVKMGSSRRCLLSRNPFQGGMGFFTIRFNEEADISRYCRNPFQGGMGFFTISRYLRRRE